MHSFCCAVDSTDSPKTSSQLLDYVTVSKTPKLVTDMDQGIAVNPYQGPGMHLMTVKPSGSHLQKPSQQIASYPACIERGSNVIRLSLVQPMPANRSQNDGAVHEPGNGKGQMNPVPSSTRVDNHTLPAVPKQGSGGGGKTRKQVLQDITNQPIAPSEAGLRSIAAQVFGQDCATVLSCPGGKVSAADNTLSSQSSCPSEPQDLHTAALGSQLPTAEGSATRPCPQPQEMGSVRQIVFEVAGRQ